MLRIVRSAGAVEDVVRLVLPRGADQQGNFFDLPAWSN